MSIKKLNLEDIGPLVLPAPLYRTAAPVNGITDAMDGQLVRVSAVAGVGPFTDYMTRRPGGVLTTVFSPFAGGVVAGGGIATGINTGDEPAVLILTSPPLGAQEITVGGDVLTTVGVGEIEFESIPYFGMESGYPKWSVAGGGAHPDGAAVYYDPSTSRWILQWNDFVAQWASTANVVSPMLVPTGVWHPDTNPNAWKALGDATGTPQLFSAESIATKIGQLAKVTIGGVVTWYKATGVRPTVWQAEAALGVSPIYRSTAPVNGVTDAVDGQLVRVSTVLGQAPFTDYIARRPAGLDTISFALLAGGTSVIVSETAPPSPADGDLWLDTATPDPANSYFTMAQVNALIAPLIRTAAQGPPTTPQSLNIFANSPVAGTGHDPTGEAIFTGMFNGAPEYFGGTTYPTRAVINSGNWVISVAVSESISTNWTNPDTNLDRAPESGWVPGNSGDFTPEPATVNIINGPQLTADFVGQWCRYGDDYPYNWYQAETLNEWSFRY